MRKKNLLRGMMVLAFFWVGLWGNAQETLLEDRVEKLERITSRLPAVTGFINFRYQYSDDLSSFDIRRARLDFKGDLSPRVDYRLQLELASPKIVDAYIRYKLNPAFNVQFGQFKLPFTLENPYSPLSFEVMENSRAVSRFTNIQDVTGIKANGRDFGVSVYGRLFDQGGFSLIEYTVGIFNGTGINTGDNNKVKDVVGRLELHPIKELTVSVSGYKGQWYAGETSPHVRRDRFGFGLRYLDDRFLVRTEYLKGFTGNLESEGYYALFGYQVTGRLQPVVRYDYYQQDVLLSESRQTDYLAGLNYKVSDWLRFQANYTWRTFDDRGENSGLLGLMLTAMF